MMIRNLSRWLQRLEKIQAPIRVPRIVVRFQGRGNENRPQPREEDLDENDKVIVVRFVKAHDGHVAAT
jgi:hypothetical protein